MQSKTSYRFLIIRWSGMGDVVMTLPAVRWLRNRFNTCHITYLSDAAYAKIIETSGCVDTIETFNRKGFSRPGTFIPSFLSLIPVLWRLYRGGFDYAFDLQGFGETALLAFLSGAKVRIGRSTESFLRKQIYTNPIRADWGRDHRSLFFLRAVAGAFGPILPDAVDPPKLRIRPPDNAPKDGLLIGLNIGASTESRRWSEQHFFELARRLAKKQYKIRLFIGPQEAFLMETVKKTCDSSGWELCSQQEMEPLIESLSECALLVSNDTGPGHLAAALDVPVITLYSTGFPENVGPLAVHSRWFRDETDIDRIRVEAVEETCIELLRLNKR